MNNTSPPIYDKIKCGYEDNKTNFHKRKRIIYSEFFYVSEVASLKAIFCCKE